MVEHAMRFTVRNTRRACVYPATHCASRKTDVKLPRMGERFRLRQDFDITPIEHDELRPPDGDGPLEMGYIDAHFKRAFRLTLKDQALADRALDREPEPLRRLDTAVLEALILKGPLGLTDDDIDHMRGLGYARFGAAPEVETVAVARTFPSQSLAVLNATGYVVAQRKAAVSSKATGRLEWLGVLEGSRVKKGEVIARVESRDVAATVEQAAANVKVAEANLEQGQAELADAESAFKRSENLLAQKYISPSAHDSAIARYRSPSIPPQRSSSPEDS